MTTYYPLLLVSRILLDADRSSLSAADDGDVTGHQKVNKIIIATQIGYESKDTAASTYKLQWRDVTDSGSFADVAATGECKWSATSAVLADGTAVTTTTRRCTAQAGMTWQDGLENLADNLLPDAGTLDLASDGYTELQWGIDVSDSQEGHQYEFQLYNNTAGAAVGTCLAQITIARNLVLTADTTSYSLTGTALTLTWGRSVVADAGSYALTGTMASLFLNRAVIPDSGAYALTGTDVTLTYTPASNPAGFTSLLAFWMGGGGKPVGAYTLTAESGSYALTGTDAGLVKTNILGAEAGSYVLTGTDAALLLGRAVIPEAGAYALTGTDVELFKGRILSAEPGSYELIGTAVDLLAGRVVVAGGGAYVLTGTAATLEYSGEVGGIDYIIFARRRMRR